MKQIWFWNVFFSFLFDFFYTTFCFTHKITEIQIKYPKFRPVSNFAKPIVSSWKHSFAFKKCSPYRAAKLTCLTQWFARRWWQIRRIVVVENSPVILRIFIYFVIPSLKSVTSLNSTKHKAMTRKSESWVN